jgi:multimeric flavodoxin WrbA
MKLLLINGSHRRGNTDLALQKITKLLTPKFDEIRELRLRDIDMKLPDGCEMCADSEMCPNNKDEFSERIEPSIRHYDVYIIASPTWDDGVTPLTKIFWDRIVSWCHDDRKYLKGKKLAVITHGMADKTSWKNVVNWVKSICIWEEATYAGSLTFKSGAKIGDFVLPKGKIDKFIENLLK